MLISKTVVLSRLQGKRLEELVNTRLKKAVLADDGVTVSPITIGFDELLAHLHIDLEDFIFHLNQMKIETEHRWTVTVNKAEKTVTFS